MVFFLLFQDLGVFIPAMTPGMRSDLFQDAAFLQTRLTREILGGLADMFGQMPGTPIRSVRCLCCLGVLNSKKLQICQHGLLERFPQKHSS